MGAKPLTKPPGTTDERTNPWGVRWFQAALVGICGLLVAAAVGTWLGLDEPRATNGETLALDAPIEAPKPVAAPAKRPVQVADARTLSDEFAELPRASDQNYDMLIESLDFLEEIKAPAQARQQPEAREEPPLTIESKIIAPEEASLPVSAEMPVLASLTPEREAAPETLPAWRRYASLRDMAASAPMIALVIDDLGFTERQVVRSMALDPAVTLAFLPYTPGASRLAATARQAGFELLVHLPMEPADHAADPGPDALLLGLSEAEFARRLERNLSRFGGYVGVNNHMGSAYTRDEAAMGRVMQELRARGLLFLDSVTTPASIAWRAADTFGVPHASRDVFIDADVDAGFIESQLALLESLARQRGAAIGIGHPYPETFAVLERWLPSARERGVTLVPLSRVVARACGC